MGTKPASPLSPHRSQKYPYGTLLFSLSVGLLLLFSSFAATTTLPPQLLLLLLLVESFLLFSKPRDCQAKRTGHVSQLCDDDWNSNSPSGTIQAKQPLQRICPCKTLAPFLALDKELLEIDKPVVKSWRLLLNEQVKLGESRWIQCIFLGISALLTLIGQDFVSDRATITSAIISVPRGANPMGFKSDPYFLEFLPFPSNRGTTSSNAMKVVGHWLRGILVKERAQAEGE